MIVNAPVLSCAGRHAAPKLADRAVTGAFDESTERSHLCHLGGAPCSRSGGGSSGSRTGSTTWESVVAKDGIEPPTQEFSVLGRASISCQARGTGGPKCASTRRAALRGHVVGGQAGRSRRSRQFVVERYRRGLQWTNTACARTWGRTTAHRSNLGKIRFSSSAGPLRSSPLREIAGRGAVLPEGWRRERCGTIPLFRASRVIAIHVPSV